MLGKVIDLEVAPAIDFVARDESTFGELVKKRVEVAVVVRQRLDLDRLRSVLQSSLAIGNGPQSGEQQTSERLYLSEFVIEEEVRFDEPNARHSLTSP
jgi:hypothetical protein